jgi:hypothetical protein
MLLFGVGSIAFLSFTLVFFMPLKARFGMMVVLALPQFLLPSFPESASIFQVWIGVCSLAMFIRERPKRPSIYGKILVGMAMIAIAAALWSPAVNLAVISAAQILSLLAIALHAASLASEDPRALQIILKWLSFGVIAEAVMVVVFRLGPSMEMEFLHSDAARYLLGTDKLFNFWNGGRDNVYDAAKAGGLWVNANTASLFLGVSACTFFAAGARYRSKWLYFSAVLAASGVAFTGSKTGVVLVIALPAVAVLLPSLTRPKGRAWILPVVLFAYPVTLVIENVADVLVPQSVIIDSAGTLGTRSVIWETAGILFQQNPYIGLGFGGWEQQFIAASGAALGRYFPPHNVLIGAWADTGLLGAAALVVFFVAVLAGHLKLMARSPKRESYAWGFGFASFLWLLIHGQADAVTFYGDLRTMILPGILLGFLISESGRCRQSTPDAQVDSTERSLLRPLGRRRPRSHRILNPDSADLRAPRVWLPSG